jgi:hypothetical protein
VDSFDVETKQPDGSWIRWIYLPRDYGGPAWWDPVAKKYVTEIRATVGSGNIKFGQYYIGMINKGDVRGDIFGDLYANGTRILYKSVPCDPNWGFSMPDYDKYWDMPSGGVTFTLKAGHNTTVDETVTLPVKPPVAKVTLGLALTLLGALTPIIFSLSVVAFSELKKRYYI